MPARAPLRRASPPQQMRWRRLVHATALLLALVCAVRVAAHAFELNEEVPVFVNMIRPINNPSETYEYYSLPFPCRPAELGEKREWLGEVLEGDRLVRAPYSIRFREDVNSKSVCGEQRITKEDVAKLRKAVLDSFMFDVRVDDVPAGSWVGFIVPGTQSDLSDASALLALHLHFHVGYNNDQIVEVFLTMSDKESVLLNDEEVTVDLKYSVDWHVSTVDYSNRIELNAHELLAALIPTSTGDGEIRWMTLLNGLLLVVFVVLFLASILVRVMRRDFAKYSKLIGDDEEDEEDETGWKALHGDVFRNPSNRMVFSAFVGVGIQFLALVISMLLLVLLGAFASVGRGGLVAAGIVMYALTAAVSGYVSTMWYSRMEGTHWLQQLLLTAFLYAGPFWVVGAVINSVAIAYGSTQALPAGTIVAVIAIWALVAFPMTIFGGVLAKRYGNLQFDHPTKTRMVKRAVPSQPLMQSLPVQMLVGGMLPFSSIYLELYYVFASMWGLQWYSVYGVLLFVFFVLVVLSACITVCVMYFQLSSENYNWWWRSMLVGGAPAILVFLYSIYFFVAQSHMSGLLQTIIYLGNVLLGCYALFLLLGAIGYIATLMLVTRMYRAIKSN